MTEEYVAMIGVEQVEEHEDGSATFTLHTNKETTKKLAKYGLDLVLYCAAYGWDIQDALDSLKKERRQTVLDVAKDLFDGVAEEDMVHLKEVSSYDHNYYNYKGELLYSESDDDKYARWFWVRGWEGRVVAIGRSYYSNGDRIIVDHTYT